MSSLRSGSRDGNAGAPASLVSVALLVLAFTTPYARAQQPSANAGWQNVDLAGYRRHLQALDAVVADCQSQLKLKTPPHAGKNACDPSRVGPNDRVEWPGVAASQAREVRYDWLRSALSRAENKDTGAPTLVLGANTRPKNPPADANDLLNQAHQRLGIDEQHAAGRLASNPSYADQRKSLNAILAQREYNSVRKVSVRDRILEWFDNLLARILMRLAEMGGRAPWAGRLLEIVLLGGICVLLIWFLVRLERSARVRLVPDIESGPGAPSAREWQLWLKDAQAAAATGQWRQAIHSVYWASIARLEAGRLWPADRARTPREYLGLLGGSDPRKPTLTALTRSFERTWYGGREAGAIDFTTALQLAAELGVAAL